MLHEAFAEKSSSSVFCLGYFFYSFEGVISTAGLDQGVSKQLCPNKDWDTVHIGINGERLQVRCFAFTPAQSVIEWCTCPSCPSVQNWRSFLNPYCNLPTSCNLFPQFPSRLLFTGFIRSTSTPWSTAPQSDHAKQIAHNSFAFLDWQIWPPNRAVFFSSSAFSFGMLSLAVKFSPL